MSTTITGINTFDALITIPSDGDQHTAASANAAANSFANRTTYLKTKVDTSGVPRIRFFTTLALLKASTGNTTHDVALLHVSVDNRRLLYVFDSTATGTEMDPVRITPDTGGGRWLLTPDYSYLDVTFLAANKSRLTNDSEIVPHERNRIIFAGGLVPGLSSEATTSTTFINFVTDITIPLPLAIGDIVDLEIQGPFILSGTPSTGGDVAIVQPYLNDGATSYFNSTTSPYFVSDFAVLAGSVVFKTRLFVTVGGNYVVKTQFRRAFAGTNNGATLTLNFFNMASPNFLYATVIRP